jgi:hypothetical protein
LLSDLGFKVVRKEDLRPTMMVEFKVRYLKDETELEFLAREEHKGWVNARKSAGRRSGPAKNDYLKRDPLLVKYKNLKSREKEAARETIRRIPYYFEHLEYKIVRAKRGKLKL